MRESEFCYCDKRKNSEAVFWDTEDKKWFIHCQDYYQVETIEYCPFCSKRLPGRIWHNSKV